MRFFVFIGTDRPGALELRRATKAAHRAYLDTAPSGVEVLMSGPTLDAAGDETGSIMILRAPGEAALMEFFAAEPYHLSGLYAETEIRPWLWKRGNPHL
jgi:uncharacterized protein YciI